VSRKRGAPQARCSDRHLAFDRLKMRLRAVRDHAGDCAFAGRARAGPGDGIKRPWRIFED
jgi:hypothetical protein